MTPTHPANRQGVLFYGGCLGDSAIFNKLRIDLQNENCYH